MSSERATGPDTWSKVARDYQKNIVPGFQPAAEALCRFAGIKSGDKVLDIGCGPGTASMAAAALGAEVTGVDSAPGMIALAKELAGSKRNLSFLEGDALQLPVQSNEFDAVVSSFGVIFAPSARKAVAEMARVLVAGGRLGILAWPRSGAIGRYYDLLDKHLAPQPSPHDPLKWGDLAQARQWLTPQFEGIATADIEVPFDAPSPEKAWEMLRVSTGRAADAYAALAPEARGAMDREMVEFFRSYRKPDGKVRWPRKAVMIRASRPRADPARKDNLMRSGIAVLAGYMAMAIAVVLTTSASAAAMLPTVDSPPTVAFLGINMGLGLLAAILGGYVTTRLAPQNPRNHVAALGGVILVLGILSARAGGMQPAWFRFGIIGIGLAGAALGGLLLPWMLRKKA
ncbi:MAG: class I SAM-dependent methyltransferase [Gemmatimonadales bacterium]